MSNFQYCLIENSSKHFQLSDSMLIDKSFQEGGFELQNKYESCITCLVFLFCKTKFFRCIFIFWIYFLMDNQSATPLKVSGSTCFWIKFISRPKYQMYCCAVGILLRSNDTLMPWLMFIPCLTQSFANLTSLLLRSCTIFFSFIENI